MPQESIAGSSVDIDSTESCLIRTDDILCLASVLEDEDLTRGYLAAEGYGARICHLEPDRSTSGNSCQVPNELWKCAFRIAQCCSVHELRRGSVEKRQSRNVLIYGHAVQFEHLSSGLLLSCLATLSSTDKQAFDVGLVESQHGLEENCWFSVHPVSQQRSEGEKVREGDDVVLVNIANERYLSVHLGRHSMVLQSTDHQFLVQTSFSKCAWSLQMFRLGSAKEAAIGYANGGDVISIVLQGRSDCLSVPLRRCDKVCHKQSTDFKVVYATAREEVKSLWRIELPTLKFGGAFTGWRQPFRLRHVVTGMFLTVDTSNPSQLTLCGSSEAGEKRSLFCCRRSWGDIPPKGSPGGKTNVMGDPSIKFGDCTAYIQHVDSKMWLGYPSTERSSKSDVQVLEARLLKEPHANFAFIVTRATEEQIKATMLVNFSYFTIREYVNGLLDPNKTHQTPSDTGLHKKMDGLLEILHSYFNPSESQDERTKSSLIRKRQNLFMKQGSLMMIVSVMDRIFKQSKWNYEKFLDTQKKLYRLLVAMIKGNNGSCAEFAVKDWFDEFIGRLQKSPLTHELLSLLQCVLEDSPQAIHLISDNHIRNLIQLLAKKGCDKKILHFLTSLCVLQGIAIRDKQRAIAKHALTHKNLFLSSTLQQGVLNYHVKPAYLSSVENSAMSRKWYFEAMFKYHCNGQYSRKPHVRIGWAHPDLYKPYPTFNGFQVTNGSIGHDLYSVGCDGSTVWVGECDVLVEERKHSLRRQANFESSEGYQCILGCCVDLDSLSFQFYVNGRLLCRPVVLPQMTTVTPVCSISGGVSVELFLGNEHGEFIHPPPPGYIPLSCYFDYKQDVVISEFVELGDPKQKLYRGPMVKDVSQGFVPTPIDTTKISLPDELLSVRHQLAEHIHDIWSRDKVASGWVYGKTRNDCLKQHPCLKCYDDLSEEEKRYDYNLAFETIATLIGLGYEVAFDNGSGQKMAYQELDPAVYQQSNGYLPRPIDLTAVSLPKSVLPLIERLAENTHNIWAVDRIREGWTYGISENCELKQNPALVPYQYLSDKLKESNRNTALESFKSLYAFGARIIPPEDKDHGNINTFVHESSMYNQKKRTIRGQLNYAQILSSGQWYYEVTILTSGSIRVGWAKPTMHPETGLGEDEESFAFDGSLGRKVHGTTAPFGRPWSKNDVVGCLLDCEARTMCFSINGVILSDSFGDPIAFSQFDLKGGLVPAVTLGPEQEVKFNFGKDEETQLHKLDNYGFGPSQGYVPIAKNAHKNLPLWYSVDYPVVQTLKENNHPRLTVTKRSMDSMNGHNESILVAVRDEHTPVFSRLECIRLNTTISLPSDGSPSSGKLDAVHLHRQKSLVQEMTEVCSKDDGSYTVYIPSGQDPRHVLVGWTAPDFVFSPSTLTATLAERLDENASCVDQSVKIGNKTSEENCALYSCAFLVPLFYLVDESQTFMSIEITSVVRGKSRQIEFCVDGAVVKKLPIQSKADIKLYPTVIISPSPETNHLLSFIMTETPSMETNVLVTETSMWVCCPEGDQKQVVQRDKLALTCEKADPAISILVPWEDRVFNLREITEDEHLSSYHVATLKLLEGLSMYGYSQSTIYLKIQEILGQDELLYMLQLNGLPYNLKAAVCNLARVLFVQERVMMRSFVKEESIVCLPPKKEGDDDGTCFNWSEDKYKEMRVGQLSATYHGEVHFEGQMKETLMKLKEIVFSKLNSLLNAGHLKCHFLSKTDSIFLLQPLIELCDDLLVAGVLNKKSELSLLLYMLDPRTFPIPEGCSPIPCGMIGQNLEEPIKVSICRLLHHIHDCQQHQRLQYVFAFSEVLVKMMQKEQEVRYANGESRRSREFMSTPEQQMEFILTPREARHSSSADKMDGVLKNLEVFHLELCRHSGVIAPPNEDVKDGEDLLEKLQHLYSLMSKNRQAKEPTPEVKTETEVNIFHNFAIKLMMRWSQMEISNRDLIKELYSLLYRQHNRASEVARSLQKTFVVYQCYEAMSGVFDAVGLLRSLLTVGMGSMEEMKLKDSLKKISNSQVFKENPELIRFLKVHTTALSLLRDYLGVTEVKGKEWKKKTVRKRNAVLQGVVSEPVQACCGFLHSFTCISEQNQIVMFEHIDFLLKCTANSPELLNFAGHGPIDVASATINNNEELVIFLQESQLEGVVKLLSQQFTKQTTLCASSVKTNDVWTMRGANKCLEFLSHAVWCKGKYVKENALVVIRLLLRHSKCLDPIVNNRQGLSDLFRSAIFPDFRRDGSFSIDGSHSPTSQSRHSHSPDSSEDETESRKSSEFSTATPRSSSLFGRSWMSVLSPSTMSMASSGSLLMADSEGATLKFLADLLKLLGYCAPSLPDNLRFTLDQTKVTKKLTKQATRSNLRSPSPQLKLDTEEGSVGNLETSIARHTHSLLHDLIDHDDILEVLNIPLSIEYWDKFNPLHKEACLLFYDRVYGIQDSEQLHQFISSVSLPDVKFTINMATAEVEDEEEAKHLFILCEYVTDHLLPVMSKKEHLLEALDTDLAHDTIENFLLCCYQFSVAVPLSPVQRTRIAEFLATVCRAMKPKVLMNLMPKILNDVPELQPRNIAALKFLTQHYNHFKRYYHLNAGWKSIGFGAASDEERRYTSNLCFKLLQRLCYAQIEPHVLSYGVKCLKVLVASLHPGVCVAVQDTTADSTEYKPRKIDVSKVVLTSLQESLVEDFCVHMHDTWAQDMLSSGWEFDSEYNEELQRHPNIVHFKHLSSEEQETKRSKVLFLVKLLLVRGWGIIASKNKHTTDLSKAFDTVELQRKRNGLPQPSTATMAVPNVFPTPDTSPSPLHSRYSPYLHIYINMHHLQKFGCKDAVNFETTDHSSSQYTPSPYDLSQVKASRMFTHISRNLARWSHERWAAQLMEEDEGYRDHPNFKPFEDLDDDVKEDMKSLPLDLLKFINFSGYSVVRTRAQTWAKEGMLVAEGTERFATLLFTTLLDILRSNEKQFCSPKGKVVLGVVLPILSEFLNSNALLFHSHGSGNMEELPRKEKSLLIKLLSQVWHFCQQNYQIICQRRTLSKPSLQSEISISVTSECLNSLCKALQFKEFVMSKTVEDEEAIALQEFLDGSLLELETAQHQGKELTLPMFDFNFRVIVPSLMSFFKCLSFRKDHKVLQTKLGSIAARIFYCIFEFARQGLLHSSFVTGDVYSAIGDCLAAFIEAFPTRILESSEDSLVISVTELTADIERAVRSGSTCSNVEYVVQVVLPLLCSHIGKYWIVQLDHKQSRLASQMSADQLSKTVTDVANLIKGFFGQDSVPWMFGAVGQIRLMLQCCSTSFLDAVLVPMTNALQAKTLKLWQDEVYVHSHWSSSSPEFGTYLQALLGQYTVLSRDLIACVSILTVFLDGREGSSALVKCDSLDLVFTSVTQIFHCWYTSPHLKREFLSQQGIFLKNFPNYFHAFSQEKNTPGMSPNNPRRPEQAKRAVCNILKLCVGKLLRYHVNKLSSREKSILSNCRCFVEASILDSQALKVAVQEKVLSANGSQAQRGLLQRSSSLSANVLLSSDQKEINMLVELVKIEHRLHQGDVVTLQKSPSKWKKIKVLTDNRRRAVIQCFMSVPYFKLPLTRAMNIFLHAYQKKWFDSVEKGSHLALREKLIMPEQKKGEKCPLTQLLHFLSHEALAGQVPAGLYSEYGLVLSLYCNVFVAEDEMDEDDPTINYKKFAEMRARLLENQNHLCVRGAAVTVLQVLASIDGQYGILAEMSIHLGIALLKGGNESVQKAMLEKLGTMDAEVLKCIESLIGRCSVLRWEGHERSGYSSLENHCTGNLPDYKFIWSLFRFLQLLCEGHNEEFQNYLRTQDSNSATINIVVCTVDYLLRLQESISDYCWYLSEDGVVGSHRREALNRAMMLSNQVLRTLTEYIQGPCIANQQALASSRVWDATSGFLKLFASLQWKLGKNSNHIELLLDLMKVQNSLFTFLQGMLEGVEMNSMTARIMANMLVEESQVVMDIMQFYGMFLELKDLVTAQAFKEYDLNGDGWISRSEFQRAMEVHSSYNPTEIDYMMDCADLDKDGRLDYLEFTRRFHSPAEQIGFDLCVLITTLAEHLPNNKNLECFQLKRSSIFDYFEKSLGRIEIVGKSGAVERVYYEIKPWWMLQWKERQVQDSKREFIQNLDVHSQRQKLGAFIDFCEDTIFEIQHAAKINETESLEVIEKAEQHKKQHLGTSLTMSALDSVNLRKFCSPVKVIVFLLHLLSVVRTVYLPKFKRKCVSLWYSSTQTHLNATWNGQPQGAHNLQLPVKNSSSDVTVSPSANNNASTPVSTDHPPKSTDIVQLKFNRSEIKSPSEFNSIEVDSLLTDLPSACASEPMISASHRMASWSSTLARYYYKLYFGLLILTALINVCLLSYKIAQENLKSCIRERRVDMCATGLAASTWVNVVMTLLGLSHTLVAGILLVAYYNLKIPLLLFKREKQIARKLEFSKKWLSAAPESYQEKWDTLVLKSPMFPKLLWDRQLKSRLIAQHGPAALPIFGLDKHKLTTDSLWSAFWILVVAFFDKYLRYYVWSLGVLATNVPLLYRCFGLIVSILGLIWSPFFFSIHLLEIIWSSKDLQNVLKSVMLNYRQVVVTLLMTCAVVYLYTVVAFNMFQKYYLTDQSDSVVPNCDTMYKCFLYHLNHGLRSGGGIADVIASAVDDEMEGIRLIFDMSFFFFVIIILLAIIQGLIIDSFGKLRNKEEARKEEMQTHCFICGLQKDKLEEIPHGFEQHTQKEHHMAHYMFFLMHLIQKPETEFTGQESHVWEQYCQRKWDFFPVAESFRHRKTKNRNELLQES